MDVGEATFTLGDFLRLKRLSTPTVYNGWEQISAGRPPHDSQS